MNARAIALTGLSALIILCGTCIGVHLKPIMGKLRTAPERTRPSAGTPSSIAVQEAVRRALAGPEPCFAPGTAGLTGAAQERLDSVYPLLLRHPGLRVEVRGFADGSSPRASELARQRAQAVRAYLIFHGIAEERISFSGATEAESIPACRFALIVH